MANAVPSRLGEVDLQAGDPLALFLKIFAGEVLTAFEETTTLRDKTRLRVIEHGKSAQFPATFKASAAYHTPGTELVGKPIAHNEVVITVDDLLVADVFIAEIDEAMNHYDVRAPYSLEIGRTLGVFWDKNIARCLIAAARGPALFTGDVGGQSITDEDADSNASSLADSIIASKQSLEEAEVPVDQMQVWAALKPAQWYLLSQEPTKVLNRDIGGEGSYARGTFSLIGGVNVVKANALPWGVDDSLNTDIPSKYRVDMSTTVGAVFVDAAVATVQLRGLAMESARDIRRQGHLIVGKYAVGHGPLRNKCAVEIKTA